MKHGACPLLLVALLSAHACRGGVADRAIGDENPHPGTVEGTIEGRLADISHLAVRHANRFPTRLAEGPSGRIFVSDARAGVVFIYSEDLELVGELGNLDRPLGVAVDRAGSVYVGDDARDSVEVYDSAGNELFTIGDGNIQMPNDLALAPSGELYVIDSLANRVEVFTAEGAWLRSIGRPGDGNGELRFPTAIAISCRPEAPDRCEIFVADQGHARIQVFNPRGELLRLFGEAVESSSEDWEGRFVKLQSLAIDDFGHVHAADTYMNTIQILDANDGRFLESYGSFGTLPGELNLPLDILLTSTGKVVVANALNSRVEVIRALP